MTFEDLMEFNAMPITEDIFNGFFKVIFIL